MRRVDGSLAAPFPYFGGKATIAPIVWRRLGDTYNYIEPFCGSAAMLLARPNPGKVETINDADGFIANFWRATKNDPTVADWCDWPVNEVDLEARHRWLCQRERKAEFLRRMKHDPDYWCAQTAGWWCWGLAQWIGCGWCEGQYVEPDHPDNQGVGVCNGANKLPSLGSAGIGVHRQLPHLEDAGVGEEARRTAVIREWIGALRDRLRNVRVCCGDWGRVCSSKSTTVIHGTCGVFLDPPYSAQAGRDNAIYRVEDQSVAHDVREWCLQWGENPLMRIVLCGYEGEGHEALEAAGWTSESWKAQGGYANIQKRSVAGKQNRHRERLWFSPHCIDDPEKLFG